MGVVGRYVVTGKRAFFWSSDLGFSFCWIYIGASEQASIVFT
jgi:hypothetical protein